MDHTPHRTDREILPFQTAREIHERIIVEYRVPYVVLHLKSLIPTDQMSENPLEDRRSHHIPCLRALV